MAEQQKMTRNELEAKLVAHAWQDEAFKQELISNPRAAVEREIGQKVPESTDIRVLEETGNTIYFVLPKKPSIDELSEEQLEAVAGGDGGDILPDSVSVLTVSWDL
ncbi:NHLP leader peptide family natural product precursor [Nostoc flagelliforme FACHB-838]|uniref:NHLP leader peptide family natural product n=1 Tax=Nostoc flagelliforme FACHB-838 TaxID=2692904 RepID=A0ABR8DL04_9NOSO|nr:NHLP leader peptide family RiPP precursor [Nostoc flagelliforme]MBD2530121.1 NHLP leader peptide family natural product precursor [Nostoc flagelliforme FACHB-838]